MPTVRLNGVELFHEVVGHGDLLVMTHGAWSNAGTWAAVVPALAERFRVATWDRRGHSRSEDGPGGYVQDVDDLAALIEHLGAPAHLVGNSSGGLISLELVARRPDLALSAAAHESAPSSVLEGVDDTGIREALRAEQESSAAVAELLEAGEQAAAARHFLEGEVLGPGSWERMPEALKTTMVENSPTFLGELRDPTEMSVDALAATDVPLLLSHGSDSPLLHVAADLELARRLPAARVDVLEGTGHIPQRTHPELLVSSLMGFYDSVAGQTLAR